MSEEGGLRSDLGFRPAGRTSVHLSRYADSPPILSAWTKTVGFTITHGRTGMDTDHVRFARELADAVNGYLTECERLHAQNRDSETPGSAAA
jgi:hypothetical protein